MFTEEMSCWTTSGIHSQSFCRAVLHNFTVNKQQLQRFSLTSRSLLNCERPFNPLKQLLDTQTHTHTSDWNQGKVLLNYWHKESIIMKISIVSYWSQPTQVYLLSWCFLLPYWTTVCVCVICLYYNNTEPTCTGPPYCYFLQYLLCSFSLSYFIIFPRRIKTLLLH